ncbi:hypothetical protein ACRAWF_03390 [Streptomyces sp. L7]
MIVNEPVPDTFEDTPAKDRDPEWFETRRLLRGPGPLLPGQQRRRRR